MLKDNFLGMDWGLDSGTARELYDEVVLPLRAEHGIIDAHTHFSCEQIVADEVTSDVFTAMILDKSDRWPNRDHYFTQLLAGAGVPFAKMYDDSLDNRAKWQLVGEHFPQLAGTHVYLWTQLELAEIFGIDTFLNGDTAGEIWDRANERLAQPDMRPQALLRNAKAQIICTTDDPVHGLEWHDKAGSLDTKILPTFRPDVAMNIDAEGWGEYVGELGMAANCDTTSFDGFFHALRKRHEFFRRHGAVASDHGLLIPYGAKDRESSARKAFGTAISGGDLTSEQIAAFKSYFMHECVKMDRDQGMVTQIHFGPLRNVNTHLKQWGKDVGGDLSVAHMDITKHLIPLLDSYCSTGDRDKDAKVVLYSLSPAHYAAMAQLMRAFPGAYFGGAWWFNDSHEGMRDQFRQFGSVVGFNRYSGMVCDGRKLVSLEMRHDVHARAACCEIGYAVENGMMPLEVGKQVVANMVYHNQYKLFFGGT